MKIPIRRYQLALLLSLLALAGVSISAQRIWEVVPIGLKAKLQSFQRSAPPTASPGTAKSPTDSNAIIAAAPALDPAQDRFNIPLYVIPGGGDASTDGRFNTTGAIGQAVLGDASDGGRFAASGGFWVAGGFQCSPITINPATLPTGLPAVSYNQTLTQTGGSGALTWSLSAGALPNGISLSSSGTLAGTTAQPGTFNFTVKVTDANGCMGTRNYTLTINPPACGSVTVSPATLPPGTVGSGYSQNFSAAGGSPAYTFSVTAGSLPSGLSLSGGGTLAGAPTASGTFNFTVTATDALNCVGSRAYTLMINPQTQVNRIVRAVAASGAPGSQVIVPIELVSQGDENAVSFSLTFDPAVLTNPQVALGGDATAADASLGTNLNQIAAGRLGLFLALPAGQRFNAGVRRILDFTFTIAAATSADSTNIGFGDQPVARNVTNVNTDKLPASYTGALVNITRGIEADVAPRPNGNGTVTGIDFTLIGRFVLGLETAANGGEFQRADSAPIGTRGDGVIDVSDVAQARRYVAGLNELQPAGGPTMPANSLAELTSQPLAHRARDGNAARVVRALSMLGRGAGTLVLTLDALGDENALSFGLRFNPAEWRYVAATAGDAAPADLLMLNTNEAPRGQLGLVLALPAGQTFAAGARELVALTFAPVAGASSQQVGQQVGQQAGRLPPALLVGFADAPVACAVVSADASKLVARFSGAMDEPGLDELSNVSAASFRAGNLAPEQIVAAYGKELASERVNAPVNAPVNAEDTPLPTELAGTRVAITDSQGVTRAAPLFFVSPEQINYQIPAVTAEGVATVTVTREDQTVARGIISISAVAPGLFTADGGGQDGLSNVPNVPNAVVMRVDAAGTQSFEALTRFDEATRRNLPNPIDPGAETDQVYLILYATGLRGRSELGAVKCTIGGVAIEVLFAGEAAGMVGVDQINLRIPRRLFGRGEAPLVLTVDGQTANTVIVSLK